MPVARRGTVSSESPGTSGFVILAAVDASEAAHEILRVAANLAQGVAGSELHLVHVAEDLPPPGWRVHPALLVVRKKGYDPCAPPEMEPA